VPVATSTACERLVRCTCLETVRLMDFEENYRAVFTGT
jgi:hypothetical protein